MYGTNNATNISTSPFTVTVSYGFVVYRRESYSTHNYPYLAPPPLSREQAKFERSVKRFGQKVAELRYRNVLRDRTLQRLLRHLVDMPSFCLAQPIRRFGRTCGLADRYRVMLC